MEIIPAILPKNFREIEEKIDLIKDFSNKVQIDICDGKYVPTITWPYWKADVKPDENFEAILREDRGMPEWERIDYEFDLMIKDPSEDDARKWLSAGATKIILHLESSKDLNPVLNILNGLVEIGIAIGNLGNVEDLRKYIDKIQFVQVMGIRKAGFQGQKFEETTLEKVKEIKKVYPNIKVQVDGGVSLDNADSLKEAGVDSLAVGSPLFGNNSLEDIVDTIEQFRGI
jgi:ribulose-phosphate 3-epimerase